MQHDMHDISREFLRSQGHLATCRLACNDLQLSLRAALGATLENLSCGACNQQELIGLSCKGINYKLPPKAINNVIL